MRRTISQQSLAGLTAEPLFGPRVAPPVLVMQGKESGIAEIEPEHIDRLVQVELLTQGAQIRIARSAKRETQQAVMAAKQRGGRRASRTAPVSGA
jgi:hypothetical protein